METFGSASNWRGFTAREAEFEGLRLIIVVPPVPKTGRYWIWKTEFLNAFPAAEEELLRRGFYIVHLDVLDLYGSPQAVRLGNALHDFVTGKLGFAEKVGLIGLSRGGLWAYNWAVANPEKVTAIFADNPVCDFKSWPGGLGSGPGSVNDWEKCLKVYGLTTEEARTFRGNPIDNLSSLVAAHIPVLHVIGDADEVVPVVENSDIVRDRYRALGGSFEEIVKPGYLHHPHGLDEPAPIADFFESHLGSQSRQKLVS